MRFLKNKTLGQHFLTRPEISKNIVSFAEIKNNDNVVEIGPGAGILTQYIVASNPKKIVLVELDERLISELGAKYPKIDVVNQDAAKVDYTLLYKEYFKEGPYLLLGNLPYNASTAILESICHSERKPDRMVLMFQKEVAQRIVALPGSKVYGRLSLLASEFYNIRNVLHLPPGAFTPPPRVDSSVLLFTLRPNKRIDVQDRKTYEQVIHASFSNKRKMIKNNLKAIIPAELLDDVLSKCDILPGQRPEEIFIEKYAVLANLLYQLRMGDKK